jgi:hypothetical protein
MPAGKLAYIFLGTLLLKYWGSKGAAYIILHSTTIDAFIGVSNYCHSAYDWSAAEENPSIMYVEMGDETDSAYQVVFRSYTGAFVYFNVDKSSGTTKIEEYVPALNVRSDAGTIEIYDYLNTKH